MSVFDSRLPQFGAVALVLVSLSGAVGAQQKTPPSQSPPPAGKPGKPTAPPKPPAIPVESQRAAAQFERALRLHRAGKAPEAIAAYQEFLRQSKVAGLPQDVRAPAYLNLAQIYQTLNKPKEQEDALREAIRVNSRNDLNKASAYAQLAALLAGEKRMAEAQTLAKTALNVTPAAESVSPAHFALGIVAADRKDFATAEKEFALAISAAPNSPAALYNYAQTLGQRGKVKPALAALEKCLTLAPKFTPALVLKGALKQRSSDFAGALTVYNVVLGLQPKDTVVLLNRAICLQKLDRASAAIDGYLKVLNSEPKNLIAHANLGLLYFNLGNFSASKLHYEAALKQTQNDPRIFAGLAMSETEDTINLHDPNQRATGLKRAEAHFKQALALDPKSVAVQNGLASLYERTDRFTEAIALYRKRQVADPDNIEPYYRIANAYIQQKDADNVLKVWHAYRQRKPDDPISYRESARILEATARYEPAIAEWNLLLARHPNDGDALLAMGKDYDKLKRFDEARTKFKAVLTLDAAAKDVEPKNRTVAIAARKSLRIFALHALADVAQEENKNEEAVSWLTQAKQLEGEQAAQLGTHPNSETFRASARAYEQSRKPELAEKEYLAWAKAIPDDPMPYAELARLQESRDKLTEAADSYRKAAERAPDAVMYRLRLAEMYARHQKNDLALTEYEALRQKYPTDARVLSPLAQRYELLGDNAKALAVYDALLKADPNAHWAKDKKAVCLRRLKRYAEAQTIYEKEIERNPEGAQTYADLAQVYTEQGKADAFLMWMQAKYEKSPANFTLMSVVYDTLAQKQGEPAARAYLRGVLEKNKGERRIAETLAMLLVRRGHRDEAVEIYRQVAAQNPKDLQAQTMLAQQLYAGDKKDDAIKLYEALVARTDLTPMEIPPLRRQLIDWYVVAGKKEAAIAQCQELLKANPNDFTAGMGMAQLLTDLNRDAEALPVLTSLTKLMNYPPVVRAQAVMRIAAIYEKQGRKADAITQYREVLRLDADNATADQALKRLEAKN